MKLSFEESELTNIILEEQNNMPISKNDLIKTIANIKNITEDLELVEHYTNIIEKIKNLTEEKYNLFISNLPVENLTNY